MNVELDNLFRRCRGAFGAVALLSGGSNILALTGSIFMLAVYDRVIPSGSVASLVGLGLLAFFAYALQAMVDVWRQRMLTRIGLVIKEALSPRIYDVLVRGAASGNFQPGNAIRDVDTVQGFLSSLGPTALFDLPWLPIYLGICFAFHFWIGVAVTAGALLLIALTFISNFAAKRPNRELAEAMNQRTALVSGSQAQAETLQSMGMTYNLSAGWNRVGENIVSWSRSLADTTNLLGTVSRVARMMLQSGVLALGAYLVIMGNATGGIMIASSILSARALAPIELAIAHWKTFVAARQSWTRLSDLLDRMPSEAVGFSPPSPVEELAVENVSLALQEQRRIIVRDVSFKIGAGETLAIIGPTGSGKSTLARALVGLWQPAIGAVRLDGMSMGDWSSRERGRFIGYLPQNVTLFAGTIAENISRFDPDADSNEIVAVAKAAGIHELVARFPDGYETRVGENGGGVSGGQAQRIALARALYGNPFLVVLDEPNSNLDNEGDLALGKAIENVSNRGGIVVVITHRPTVMSSINQVLVLSEGRVQKYGPRDEVMDWLRKPRPAVPDRSVAAA